MSSTLFNIEVLFWLTENTINLNYIELMNMTLYQKYHLLGNIFTAIIFLSVSLIFLNLNINFNNINNLLMISLFFMVSIGISWALSEPSWDLWWFGEDFDEILISVLLIATAILGHFFKELDNFTGLTILMLWLSSLVMNNLDFLFITSHFSVSFYSTLLYLLLLSIYLNTGSNLLVLNGMPWELDTFNVSFFKAVQENTPFNNSDFLFFSFFLFLVLNILAPLLLGITDAFVSLPSVTYSNVFHLYLVFYVAFGWLRYLNLLAVNLEFSFFISSLTLMEFYHFMVVFSTCCAFNYYLFCSYIFILETILLHVSFIDLGSINFFDYTLDLNTFCVENLNVSYFLILLYFFILFYNLCEAIFY